jgi:hypothetical protein
VAALTEFLGTLVAPAKPPAPAPTAVAASARRTQAADQSGAVAVLGYSGAFPGAADPEQFWKLLVSGTEARPDLIPSTPYSYLT